MLSVNTYVSSPAMIRPTEEREAYQNSPAVIRRPESEVQQAYQNSPAIQRSSTSPLSLSLSFLTRERVKFLWEPIKLLNTSTLMPKISEKAMRELSREANTK